MFEWDEAKSARSREERGFDFRYTSRIFDGDVIEKNDIRQDYGELRMIAIGEVDGRIMVVAYTWRDGRRRIISARPAKRRERHDYRRAQLERDP
ncbi:MAG: BrnT family toxin [Geminicoccales bacterium]